MNLHERMESIADIHVAGGLSADERREADGHAASCAACAGLLRDAKEFSMWARGTLAPDAPPADLEERVLARFRGAGQLKKRSFPVGKRMLKMTASIAAAGALVFLGNEFNPQEALSREGHPPSAEVLVATASIKGDAPGNEGKAAWDESRRPAPGNEFAHFFSRDLGREGRDLAQNLGAAVNGLARRQAEGESERLSKSVEAKSGGGGGSFGARSGGKATADSKPEPKPDSANRLEERKFQQALASGDPGQGEGQLKGGRVNVVARGGGSMAPSVVAVQDPRKIIRNGDVSLEVESYDATYAKLAEFVAAEKGQITGANTQKMANGKMQATVTLRIPPERFEAVIAKLKDFGTIRNQNISSQDVTKAYMDLESRLKSKEILAERLRKLLAEGKGSVKELMEVEVQAGATNEAIEQIKGELKYYDNQVGLSTITLRISEKDLGQPFEYVQTLQSNLALTAKDPDDVYAKVQKEITDAGGQVVDSKMTRQSDGTLTGTIRGRVGAEKFPALREALKKLGTVTNDTVNQQKTARGGHEGAPKADAPLRREQATVDLTISSPPLFVTKQSQMLVETSEVESAYHNARRAIEAAGGKIVEGSLTGRADGMSATLHAQVDADKFPALVDSLKTAGKVKNANVNSVLPEVSTEGGPQLLRERAEIELALVSPPLLIGEEHGIVKTIRDTFARSWTGLLWSVEKLFVGLSLAGPWIAVLAAGWLLWRRIRRRKSAPAP